MNTICVVNKSTQVTDADVRRMAAVCDSQIRMHVAPAHNLLPAPVTYLPATHTAPKGARVITVMDTLDDAQALGWHTEDGSEHIWGVVGTAAAIGQGAKALTGAYSISSIVSHEVVEMFVDPYCSGWFDTGHGYLVAGEACDPVQSDWYLIDGAAVSNFVTSSWFNPAAAKTDRFDHLGHLTAPFTLSPGGYWVQSRAGRETQQFGADMPDWLITAKLASAATRTCRHSKGQVR